MIRPISRAAQATGRTRCDLCNKQGSTQNPLVCHHIDGNHNNNRPDNWMVVHDQLCHDFADFITRWYNYHKQKCSLKAIKLAWQSFTFKTS